MPLRLGGAATSSSYRLYKCSTRPIFATSRASNWTRRHPRRHYDWLAICDESRELRQLMEELALTKLLSLAVDALAGAPVLAFSS
jgi:hypothetical protein